jgi:hypothetical protein
MRTAGVDWQMNLYGGAKHRFTDPNAAAGGVPGLEYNHRAAERSRRAMLDLFEEALARHRSGALATSAADSRKPDQVEAGQRTTDLLHPAAGHELTEVDGEEACVPEKLDNLGLGICVVAGEEDHTLAA